jgi:hypothetical protein
MLIGVLKVACLATYALALAGVAGWLPAGLSGVMQGIGLTLLAIHVVELALMFRHVRLYPGPLALSVLLTLLFGLLHWKPLADARARSALDVKAP